MQRNRVASPDERPAARNNLLDKEKEPTRLRDRVSAESREMPWVNVERNCMFEAPDGTKTLAERFDGRSQLIVQRFMFAPDWDAGCVGWSFGVDHTDVANMPRARNNVTGTPIARSN